MNTQQIRCFLMVADKLNFTKAAQALYFSVPTVTHHIQNLESELGALLFVRGKKGVRLTEAGRNFYPTAADILHRMDKALESMRKKTKKTVLNLGCTSHAEMVMLTSVFSQYRKQYPQIIPHVEIGNYDLILDMFDEEQLDLVLTTDNMLSRRGKAYHFRKLCTVVGYAVTDQNDPLASHQTISFDEIEDATLIGLHEALIPGATPNKVTQRMSLHHLSHNDILCADDRMALSLCKAGYGIAVLPAYCIPEYYRDLGLAITPIAESQKIVYGLITQDDSRRDYISTFVHLIDLKAKQGISSSCTFEGR